MLQKLATVNDESSQNPFANNVFMFICTEIAFDFCFFKVSEQKLLCFAKLFVLSLIV